MLPKIDGFEVCRELRRLRVRTPIILLTAKVQEAEKVLGLELGADDYVTKPFSPRELRARIKAVLRRVDDGLDGRGAVRRCRGGLRSRRGATEGRAGRPDGARAPAAEGLRAATGAACSRARN